MGTRDKAGYLAIGRTRFDEGKLVDTWTYISPFAGTVRHKENNVPKLTVDVYIAKKGEGITFTAKSPVFPKGIIKDTDIERLRATAEAYLREQHDALTNCTWTEWFEVEMSNGFYQSTGAKGGGGSVTLCYDIILRGDDAVTGKVYYLNNNHIAMPWEGPKRAGVSEEKIEGMITSRRRTDSEYSYIPATPENRAALDDLVKRLARLHSAMADFLQQDVIQASLQNLTPFTLLPSA